MDLHSAIFLVGLATAVDGDTVRLTQADGSRLSVRLWGIAAPELSEPGGRLSKQVLAAGVNGRELRCGLKSFDRYGRPVARCYSFGQDVALPMLYLHQAADCPRFSGGHYKAFSRLETPPSCEVP